MRADVVILKSRLVASGDVTTEEQSWRIPVILKHPNPLRLWGQPSQVWHNRKPPQSLTEFGEAQ